VSEQRAIEELALGHAWNWFEYHATQRMTMLRFYLMAAGGVAAGVGVLLAANENFLAAIVSMVGMLTSFSFKRLDKRVSDLVKFGEDALKSEQLKMSTELKSQAWQICELAGVIPRGARFYTYGQNFRFLFGILMASFALTALMSFGRAVWPFLLHCLPHP
jgi:hypothetical protein